MRITLRQLEYFTAAAKYGSIKHAALDINISQPSISSAITQLETELKLQLFVRHHAQGLSLTAAGRRMVREAKILLKQAQGLYSIASEFNEEVAGTLSVGCMVTFAPMIAPELVHAFTADNPAAKLTIVEDNHDALLTHLRQVEIDVAISYDLAVPDDLDFEPLAELPPHVLVAKNHPLAKQASVTITELTRHPMILLELPRSREYFLSLFQSKGLTANVGMRASSQEVIRTMVANGYGFTITNVRPKNLTALDGRKLSMIRLAGKHKPMKIGIATLAQTDKLRVLVAFEEHCRRMISNRSIPGMSPYEPA